MPKLSGKTAVITGVTSGTALAAAKIFVEEGAYVLWGMESDFGQRPQPRFIR